MRYKAQRKDVGFRHTMDSACAFLARGISAIKNRAVSLWRNNSGLIATPLYEVIGEYFFPTGEQVKPITFKSRMFQGSLNLAVYCGRGMIAARYITYEDESGFEQRCYQDENPEKYQELTAELDKIYEQPDYRYEKYLANGFDRSIFFKVIGEMVGSKLLFGGLKKLVLDKIKVPDLPISLFCKNVARRLIYVAICEAIRRFIAVPCINFGMRAWRIGLVAALRSRESKIKSATHSHMAGSSKLIFGSY